MLLKNKFCISILVLLIIFLALLFTQSRRVKNKVLEVSTTAFNVVETVIPQPTKILETGLPDKHLIQTAFVPQAPEQNWSQPWQDACEEAALLTVNYFYQNQKPSLTQIKNDILDMVNFENKQGWGIDINVSQMAKIASQYFNYKTQIIDNPTIDQIKKFIVDDIPVIVPANGKMLFQENHFFNSGGPFYHNVVILGYDDNKKQFIVHDVGTRHGAYFHYSYNLLMNSIHDFPVSNRPEDINSGAKRVLVLLK